MTFNSKFFLSFFVYSYGDSRSRSIDQKKLHLGQVQELIDLSHKHLHQRQIKRKSDLCIMEAEILVNYELLKIQVSNQFP